MQLPIEFTPWILLYVLGAALYSSKLKRVPIIDVLCLAGLYTIRVLAGAAAVGVTPSFWLLAFSTFIFLSLALVKRYTELRSQLLRGEAANTRNYRVDDLPIIASIGVSSGLISVLVLALYVNGDATLTLYSRPELIWLACPPLLYWVMRIWFNASRGQIDEDAVVFAARDPASWLVLAAILLVFALAV